MAVTDNSLINLLLGYAALDRAALLTHPAPLNRVFLYVSKAVPELQEAVSREQYQIPLTKIAATVMLASMRYSFHLPTGHSVLSSASSRTHLRAAKILIRKHWSSKPFMDDPALAFLVQWVFRMDIQWLFRRQSLDELCHEKGDRPLIYDVFGDGPLQYSHLLGHDLIQCFLGVTFPCLMRLTKAAELTKEAHIQRSTMSAHGNITWKSSSALLDEALTVKEDLERGAISWLSQSTCPSTGKENFEFYKLATINRLFQWAALVHLNRKVFGRPRSHPDVRGPVVNILDTIEYLYHAGRAEGVLIFPLVTAGCEVEDSGQRQMMIEQCGKTGLVSVSIAITHGPSSLKY